MGNEIINIEKDQGGKNGVSADDREWQRLVAERDGFDPVVIANDSIGIVTVQDGPSLGHGEIIAPTVGADPGVTETFHNSFQDIPKFLGAGGRRGRQEQVLVEGTYYINRMFATVEIKPKTKVGIGTVGVVNSYVGREVVDALTADQGRGRTVPRNQRGIWETPLEPGMYALNPYAVEVTHVPTTNFQLRWEEGIKSTLRDARAETNRVSFDDDLKEIEVITKDGFEILLPIAAVAHIKPASAPAVIQRFSQISRFVNQTLDPLVSSYFRDAAQEKGLLEFIQNRAEIAADARDKIKERLKDHKIDIEEVLLGTPKEKAGSNNVERVLDQLRVQQLAKQQMEAFKAQGAAAEEQKRLNEKLAEAEKQKDLTASRIEIDMAGNQGDAEAKRQIKAAESIKAKADAEAHAIRARADAEAHAITARGEAQATAQKATADAIGGVENLMAQFIASKLAEAITGSPHRLVPDTQIGGGEGDKPANLVDALLALVIAHTGKNAGLPGVISAPLKNVP